MKFVFHGQLPPYLMAKDLILTVIGEIGVDGATYRAMEFAGEGMLSLNIEERMTLTNMAIEAGGKNGVIAADKVTLDYVQRPHQQALRGRHQRPRREVLRREDLRGEGPGAGGRQAALAGQQGHRPRTAGRASSTAPTSARAPAARSPTCLRGRDDPQGPQGQGSRRSSCPPRPRSTPRLQTAQDRRQDASSRSSCDAGCTIGPAGCAACLGGPADTFGRLNEAGVKCISTTNRNFPGRMGHKEAEVYLASPLTVAASAVTGA